MDIFFRLSNFCKWRTDNLLSNLPSILKLDRPGRLFNVTEIGLYARFIVRVFNFVKVSRLETSFNASHLFKLRNSRLVSERIGVKSLN